MRDAVDQWLISLRSDPQWRARARDLLFRLLRVDTTPKPSPAACAKAEGEVFRIIESYLAVAASASPTRRAPIRPEIAGHPCFTLPYYAGDVGGDRAALVQRVYGQRANLIVRPTAAGRRLLLNGHIDTVAPHLPARVEGDIVYGRGAVDDKGPCVAMLLALELVNTATRSHGCVPSCSVVAQFVIDEETGGNGSLSAVLEEPASPSDAVVVLECTGLRMHPANRGAVWYEAQLHERKAQASAASEPGARATGSFASDVLLEAAAFAVGAMERCGRQIKSESDHPLFPHRPVQTCHGRMGPYGQHPSRVNDYVSLSLAWDGPAPGDLRAVVDAAVAEYCREYGDKTQPGAGDAVLERHFRWSDITENRVTLEVFGLAGHMGAVDRLDGAITKAAAIVRALVRARHHRGAAWEGLRTRLTDSCGSNTLILEGGQGFLPTHTLEDVCGRLQVAVAVGVSEYLELAGLPSDAVAASVTFDKLHNAAYARPSDGPVLGALLAAARAAGVYDGEPVRGWDVSCDARIFAREYPAAEVVTFGPGALAQAHGNEEHVDIGDVVVAAEVLARLILNGWA